MTYRHRLDRFRINMLEVGANLARGTQMPWNVGYHDRAEMRFLREQVSMSDIVKCVIFHQQLTNNDGREKVCREAVDP